MTSSNPRPGDIWLAYVEFSDHPGVGKVRPVVIVDVSEDACTVLAAKVTSSDLTADGSGAAVPIINWQHCGLRKPSYIRLDQRFVLSRDKLLRENSLGRLPQALFQVVLAALSVG